MKKPPKNRVKAQPAPAHRLPGPGVTLQILKRRCQALNVRGEPCQSPARIDGKFCPMHTGDTAKILGARGGRRRSVYKLEDLTPISGLRTAEDMRDLLAATILDLRSGKIDTRLANSIFYAASAFLNAVEITDLEAKMEELERGRVGPLSAPPRLQEG